MWATKPDVLRVGSRPTKVPSNGVLLKAGTTRTLLLTLIIVAAIMTLLGTRDVLTNATVIAVEPELTRLLRGMAVLKFLIASEAIATVFWRLSAPVSSVRFFAYAAACGAMVVGPALIWSIAHVIIGALLFYMGLVSATLVLWRDPATEEKLRGAHVHVLLRRRA